VQILSGDSDQLAIHFLEYYTPLVWSGAA